jgi:hypothetical protein
MGRWYTTTTWSRRRACLAVQIRKGEASWDYSRDSSNHQRTRRCSTQKRAAGQANCAQGADHRREDKRSCTCSCVTWCLGGGRWVWIFSSKLNIFKRIEWLLVSYPGTFSKGLWIQSQLVNPSNEMDYWLRSSIGLNRRWIVWVLR